MEMSNPSFTFDVLSTVNEEGVLTFKIKVKQNDQEWNVERSLVQCLEFAKNTMLEFQDVDFVDCFSGDAHTMTAEEIKCLLERVYAHNSNLAATAALFAFLDDLERASWFTRSHIRYLQTQITDISTKLANYETRLSRFEMNAGRIDAFLSNNPNFVGHDKNPATVHSAIPNSNIITRNHSSICSDQSAKCLEDPCDIDANENQIEKNCDDSVLDRSEHSRLVKEEYKESNLTEDMFDAQKMWDDLSISREDSGNSSASIPEDPSDEAVLNSVFSADYMLLTNSDAYPLENLPDMFLQSFFNEIDVLIRSVQPHDTQLQYRSAAVNYIRKQSRIALGCLTYEIGLHGINCFLPTDPIRVTLPLVQNQLPQWPTALSDRLKNISEGNVSVPKSVDVTLMEDNPEDMIELFQNHVRNVNIVYETISSATATTPVNSSGSSVSTTTSNISASSGSTNPLISFQFENSLECQVTCNQRIELCNITFLQEFASLVGKDNLFKRSLLLIRSWWECESSPFVGTPMKSVLSELSLSFMLVCIFNNYHHRIQNPFEAFVLFLREFSVYEGRSQAISVQGIVPFHSDTSNQPCLVKPQQQQLITHEMLERYWHVFNVNEAANHDPSLATAFPTNAATAAASATSSFLSAGGNRAGASQAVMVNQIKARQILFMNSMSKAIVKFERYAFNIIHPFLHTNLITEKVSATRKLPLVTKVFQSTYANINTILDQVKIQFYSANGMMMISESLRRLMPSVYSKFSSHFRPDAVGSTVFLPQSGKEFINELHCRDLMNASIDKLWDNVSYCNFIAENLISESAILTFCSDTLTVKGPLPAGELGKLLSEASTIPNLSHKLREKFGGLKKFLERYADKFIFSNDHPFNPHVLLRSTISAENLELIDRGIFPIHLISKSARAAAAAKKQQQSQSTKHHGNTNVNIGQGASSQSASGVNVVVNTTTSPPPYVQVSLPTPSGVPPTTNSELNVNGASPSYYHKNVPVNASSNNNVPKQQFATVSNPNAGGPFYQQRPSTYGSSQPETFASTGVFATNNSSNSSSGTKAGRGFFHIPSLSAAAQHTGRLFFHSNSSKSTFPSSASSATNRYQTQAPTQQQAQQVETLGIKQDPNRHFNGYTNVNSSGSNNNDLLGGFNPPYSVPNDATVPSSDDFSFNKLGGLAGNQSNSVSSSFLGLSRASSTSAPSVSQDFFAENNKNLYHGNSLKIQEDGNSLFLNSSQSDERSPYRLNGGIQSSNDFNQQAYDGVNSNHNNIQNNSQTFNSFRFY